MSKLTPLQDKAALMLSEGMYAAEVARQLRLSPQTLSRWNKRAEFKERIQQLRYDATKEAMTRIKDSLLDNVEIIQSIARSGGEPGVVPSRLKAAMFLVEKILRPVEKTGISADPEKRARETVIEIERLSGEEMDDLVSRGEETVASVEDFLKEIDGT